MIPTKESNAMNRPTTSTAIPTRALKLEALANISASFEVFCLASGMEALAEMMDHDAQAACGPRHSRGYDRQAHRWGTTVAASMSSVSIDDSSTTHVVASVFGASGFA